MSVPNPGRPGSALRSRLARLALAAMVTSVCAFFVGNYAAERELIARRARLQLVWPDLAAFPRGDRELINALAVHCHLAREPLDAVAAARCLRRAASDAAFVAPAGVNAATELRRLLAGRPGTMPGMPAEVPLA